MKQHFLMKAKVRKPKDDPIGRMFSRKLDGDRAFWDGGITRGMPCDMVPWAYTEKHSRYKVKPLATGLWSSYAQPIQAPAWFLDNLPPFACDGELFGGHRKHQFTHSAVSKLVPIDSEWSCIKYMVFDAPPMDSFCQPRLIKLPNMTLKIKAGTFEWAKKHNAAWCPHRFFFSVYDWLKDELEQNDCVEVVEQTPISGSWLNELYDKALEAGAEGGMMREPMSLWVPQRSNWLWKQKPYLDAEGTVTGFTTGRSRNLGKIGALIVDFQGQRLELSGLTDAERMFGKHKDWAITNPGKDVPDWVESMCFDRGDIVTFKYRELSDGGIPKEAHYWRKRN
jgi:DNA ligase 1